MENNIFSEGWGILPRKISMNKDLTDFAKILYSELSSLCAEKGYCWATNQYLGELFGKSEKTISITIASLSPYLFIENGSGGNTTRKIYIHQLLANTEIQPLQKGKGKPLRKGKGNHYKNVIHNSISNIINNNKEIQEKDESFSTSESVDETGINKQIGEVIKEFETVNPACKKMYGNTTQRQAVTDLITEYSFEQVLKVVKFLPQSNKQCFWKATTPKQLWDNWVNIESEIITKFNKQREKAGNVAFAPK